MAKQRNYRKEYDNYHASPEQRARRASRNKARRKAMKSGRASKGDGKDVHHTTGDPMNNAYLSIRSKSKNRSFARTSTGAKKNRKS